MEIPGEFDVYVQGIAMASAPEGIGETFFEEAGVGAEPVSADDFRRTLGMFATGVTVITTRVGEVVLARPFLRGSYRL